MLFGQIPLVHAHFAFRASGGGTLVNCPLLFLVEYMDESTLLVFPLTDAMHAGRRGGRSVSQRSVVLLNSSMLIFLERRTHAFVCGNNFVAWESEDVFRHDGEQDLAMGLLKGGRSISMPWHRRNCKSNRRLCTAFRLVELYGQRQQASSRTHGRRASTCARPPPSSCPPTCGSGR